MSSTLRCLRTCVWVLAFAVRADASAQQSAPPGSHDLKFLTHVVDEQLFRAVIDRHVEGDAAIVAEAAFAVYRESIALIDEECERRTIDMGADGLLSLANELHEARNARVEAAGSARAVGFDPRWDELAEWGMRIEAVIDSAGLQADTKRDLLVASIVRLSVDPVCASREIPRRIRRELVDNVRRGPGDFRPQVDLIALVKRGRMPGGELEPLVATIAGAEDLGDVVEAYAIELDQMLVQQLSLYRKPSMKRGEPMVFLADSEAGEQSRRKRSRKATRRYVIASRASNAIKGLLADHAGAEAVDAWETRFYRSLCPELMKDRWLHGVSDWLGAQPDAAPEQLEAVSALQSEFQQAWRATRARAIRSGIAKMCSQKTADVSQHASDIYALHELGRDVLVRLKPVLSDAQRSRVRSVWMSPRTSGPEMSLLGPQPPSGYPLSRLSDEVRTILKSFY